MTSRKVTEEPASDVGTRRRRMHQVVKGLADRLEGLVSFLDSHYREKLSVGLYRVDLHLHPALREQRGRLRRPARRVRLVDPGQPERAVEGWNVVLGLFDALHEVRALWEEDIDGSDTSLRWEFSGISEGEVHCGPVHEHTHHGLVIALAQVIVHPGSFGEDGGVIRLRTVRELVNGSFDPGRLYFHLDREYARLLGRPTLQRTDRSPTDPVEPPRRREGDASDLSRLRKFLLWTIDAATGPVRRADIMKALKDERVVEWLATEPNVTSKSRSPSTVSNNLARLKREGYIEEAGKEGNAKTYILDEAGQRWARINPRPSDSVPG